MAKINKDNNKDYRHTIYTDSFNLRLRYMNYTKFNNKLNNVTQ
jgi:hypothetical protein